MMGLAMLLTLAFPLALIAAYDKAFPSLSEKSQLYSLYLVCYWGWWGNQAVVLGYLMVLTVYS